MQILITEDEVSLAGAISDYLEKQGFRVDHAASASEAEDKLLQYSYDAVLLDITLPDGNGLNLIPLIKSRSPQTGILILSAKNALEDKVKGLDLGADDYITKPFFLAELNARINALLRRNRFGGEDQLVFREISLDTRSSTVSIEGKEIFLTAKEYDLLLFFMVNAGRVLSKSSISEHLWGALGDNKDNFDFLYAHIKNLRKKLTAAGSPDYIRTVYGMGYKFTDR